MNHRRAPLSPLALVRTVVREFLARPFLACLALAVFLPSLELAAQASPTYPLSTGAGLAVGATDPNFVLISQPVGAGYGMSLQVVNFPYVSAPGAHYIAPTSDSEPAGTYDYQTSYASNFSVPTQVVISGSFACDDSCVLQINGQGSYAVAAGFSQLYPIYTVVTIPAGPQTTHLDFMVYNQGGPAGLVISNLNIFIPKATFVSNNGFESPDFGTNAFQYDPVVPNWLFTGSAGLTTNGSFSVHGAIQGQASDNSVSTSGQAAYLQTNGGAITQYVNLPAGTYCVSFDWEARDGYGGDEITVSLGGNVIFDGTPGVTANFTNVSTNFVTLPAGIYALTFSGLTAGRDVTTFIDNVALNTDTAPFVWSVASGDFSDPKSWGRTRAPGPGDTATINSGAFTVTGPIYAGTVTVNTAYTSPAGADFNLDTIGKWKFNQLVTVASGYHLDIAGTGQVDFAGGINGPALNDVTLGDGVQVTFSGALDPSTIGTISIYGDGTASFSGLTSTVGINTIYNGGGAQVSYPNVSSVDTVTYIDVDGDTSTLTFPKVTTYTQAANTSVTWQAGANNQTNNGCVLNFPALTTITGGPTTNSFISGVLAIEAVDGAVLNLPALTTITEPAGTIANYSSGGVQLTARDNGVLNAGVLTTFTDNTTNSESSLTAYDNGTLSLPELLTPYGIQMNLNAQSNPQQFTSLGGTTYFRINTGTVTMPQAVIGGQIVVEGGAQVSYPNVTDLTNVTGILVDGDNSTVVFPKVTTYTQPANTAVTWQAGANNQTNNGCVLNLPVLTTITGGPTTNSFISGVLAIEAVDGAVLNLPALTTITEPAGTIANYSSGGVQLTARDNGVLNAGVLTTFTDNTTNSESSLTAYDNGTLSLPELLTPYGIQMNLNAQSNPQQFTSLGGTTYFRINTGTVTMPQAVIGGQIVVEGGAQVSYPNVTDLTNVTGILVDGDNSTVVFPKVTTYTQPANTAVTWQAGANNQTNNGCVLNLPVLTTITGGQTTNSFISGTLSIVAADGAVLNMPALTTITEPAGTIANYSSGGIQLTARDTGTLNAGVLANFTDSMTNHESSLTAYDSGTLALPKLLAPVGIQMNLNAQSNPQQFTSLVGTTSFEINQGTVTIPLSGITGMTFIYVTGEGTSLSFPNVTSYTTPSDTSVTWQTENSGELDFPALVTITGPARTQPGNSNYLTVRADYSGEIDFDALTTISQPVEPVGTYNGNNGITLDADNSGEINAPLLDSFVDAGTSSNNESGYGPASLLLSYSSGVLYLPQLVAPVGVQINVDAQFNLAQFTSLSGTTTLELTATGGGTLSMGLSDISGFTYILVNGSGTKLSFPNVTHYTTPADTSVTWEAYNGGEMDFPSLVSIAGPARTQLGNTHGLNIRADYSSVFNFSALTTITEPIEPAGTFNGNNGVTLDADNAGQIMAPLLDSFVDSGTISNNQSGYGPASQLVAYSSGLFSFPKLVAPVGVQMSLDGQSDQNFSPSQFTSLVGTTTFELTATNAGTVSVELADITGFTYILVNGSGTKLSFPNVVNYTANADTSVTWEAYNGGELDFPSLVSIAGPARTQLGNSRALDIRADYSSVIDFSALTTISETVEPAGTYNGNNGVILDADNSGQIIAPVLSSFVDSGTNNESGYGPASQLIAYSSGVLSLPQLLAPVGLQIYVDGQSNPALFTSLNGTSSLHISGGNFTMATKLIGGQIIVDSGAQVSFPYVTDLSKLTQIVVDGDGSRLSFAGVKTYTQPANTYVNWQAGSGGVSNNACELDFPALTSITGTVTTAPGVNGMVSLSAQYGATLNLPVLASISVPVGTTADSSNSGIQLLAHDSGLINVAVLKEFDDFSTPPQSAMNTYNSGQIYAPFLNGIVNTPYPDLQVTGLAATPTAVTSGSTITISWNDANIGNGPAAASFSDSVNIVNTTTGQTLTTSFVSYDPTEPGNGNIAAGDSRARSFQYTLPSDVSGVGTFLITVTANATGSLFEFNPYGTANTNNSASLPLQTTHSLQSPALTNVDFGGAALANNMTLTGAGLITLNATDAAGMSRVQFCVRAAGSTTNTLLGVDTNASGVYSAYWNANAATNGTYIFTIDAFDSFNNETEVTQTVQLNLQPPSAPVITSPANGLATNQSLLAVIGTAPLNTTVILSLNGTPVGSALTVNGQGTWQTNVTLQSGANNLTATAQNSAGPGPASSTVQVTLDQNIPNPPGAVQATGRAGGVIQVSWSAAGGTDILGYTLYRSTSPFTSITDSGVVKLNTTLITNQLYTDSPSNQGTYYYRLTTTNLAGTTSVLSDQASAVSTNALPTISGITYTPVNPATFVNGEYGVGLLNVQLTTSTSVQSVPFFSIAPSGGGFPLTVTLTAVGTSTTTFTGVIQITPATASGTYFPTYSMRDLVGNRGAGTLTTNSIVIDTTGPSIMALNLSATSPIQNSSSTPVTLNVSIQLDEDPAAPPSLQWQLTTLAGYQTPTAVTLTQGANDRLWTGSLTLPANAGAPSPEDLVFSYAASDALGNVGTSIKVNSSFEIYQGGLPTLDAPPEFQAVAQPGGHVLLSWGAVTGASGYQIYRSTANGSATNLTAAQTINSATTVSFNDQPTPDGLYYYAIATLRTANGQTVTGPQSAPPVSATSISTPPPPPVNLQLALSGGGVLAQWHPGVNLNETVTYNIYRAAAGISATTGLQPLASGLTSPQYLDASPSPAAYFYAVTAVDTAGNESAVSTSVYLDATLLPVQTLAINLPLGGVPALSWSNPSPQIKGYNVYNGTSTSGQLLNASLLTATSFTDPTYTSGERTYTVVTLDTNNAVSLPQSILLPDVGISMAAGQVVHLNLVDQILVTVQNRSTDQPLSNAIIQTTLGGVTQQSAVFNLAPEQTSQVPVVVSALSLTGNSAPVAITLISAPTTGTSVTLHGSGTVNLASGGLSVEVVPGSFVNGGDGHVQFRILNSATETIDIVMARANGTLNSPDVRFKLFDADNNLVSATNILTNTGQNIINLPDGTSVLRLAPGEQYLSDSYTLNVPQTTATQLTIQLEIDETYYDYGQADQVVIPGMIVRGPANIANATYDGKVLTALPATSTGTQPVVITGEAVSTSDSTTLVPNVPLTLGISANGFQRTVSVSTGADGTFSYTFQPLAGEGGIYSVWLCHPDLDEETPQATFVISSVTVTPGTMSVVAAVNIAQQQSVQVATGVGTTATNLRLVATGALPTGVTLTPSAPITLGGQQNGTLSFTLTGDDTATASGTINLQLISDENSTAGWGMVTVNYQFSQATAAAQFTPGLLDVGINPGTTQTASLNLASVGVVSLESVNLNLTQVINGTTQVPAPSWISLSSASQILEIPVGQTVPVGLTIQPGSSIAPGDYYFNLKFTAANYPEIDIPIHVAVTLLGVGNVVFKVVDLLTNAPDPNYVAPGTPQSPAPLYQGVYNAVVYLQSEVNAATTVSMTTDGYGEADFSNGGAASLAAGYWDYRISAPGHDSQSGRILIQPGATQNQTVLINNDFITVTWTVVPTTIQDTYNLNLQATFQTNVPAPVVTVLPASINLPAMSAGDVYYGEFAITNHGLISADQFAFNMPASDAYNQFQLLNAVPTSVPAGQTVIVPFRVTSLQTLPSAANGGTSGSSGSATGNAVAKAATPAATGAKSSSAPSDSGGGGGGCFSYTACAGYHFQFECLAGIITEVSGTACFSYLYGDCSAAGEGGIVYVQGGGGGGGGVIYSGSASGTDCWPSFFDCNNRNEVGCWINHVTRQFEDAALDLDFRVPGNANVHADVRRIYRGNQWLFEDLDSQLTIGTDGSGPSVLTLAGSVFIPLDGTRLSFSNGRDSIVATANSGWRLNARNGSWRTFDSTGRALVSGRYAQTVSTFIYDANGHLTGKASAASGQQVLWYEWTGNQITAVHDAANNRTVYTYTGNLLSTVTDANGDVTQYFYDGSGRMNHYKDSTGHDHYLVYDAVGAATSLLDENGNGRAFSYWYDALQLQYYLREQYTNGLTRETWYDVSGALIQTKVNGVTVNQVQINNRTKTFIDGEGNTTVEQYDQNNRLLSSTFPGGVVRQFAYDPVTNRVSRYTDPMGNVTEYDHDSFGNITQKREAAGTADQRTTTYVYDNQSRITSATTNYNDGLGNVMVTFAYDGAGNLSVATDPLGQQTKYSGYDANGYYTSVVDRDQNTATYLWDPFGRLKYVQDSLGNKWQYTYDAYNNLTSQSSPLLHLKQYSFDGENNLVLLSDAMGNQTVRRYGPDDQVLQTVDGAGLTTTHSYDALGRLSTVTDPSGNVTTYHFAATDETGVRPVEVDFPTFTRLISYDFSTRQITAQDWANGAMIDTTLFEVDGRGQFSAITDAAGRRTQYGYDAYGRLKSITRPGNLTENLTYNRWNHIASYSEPDSTTWTYTYNAAGKLGRETSPTGNVRQYGYTGTGRLSTISEANGGSQTLIYDAGGRLAQRASTPGQGGAVPVTVNASYDADGNLLGYNDGVTSGTFTYDANGRRTGETVNYGPFSKTIAYTYGDDGKKLTFTAPDGIVYQYSYDSGGNLQAINFPDYGEIVANGFLDDRVTKMTYPGGVTMTYGYDSRMNPASLAVTSSAGATVSSWEVHWDGAGRIDSQTIDGTATMFGYDVCDRLILGAGGAETYDVRGNLDEQPSPGRAVGLRYR